MFCCLVPFKKQALLKWKVAPPDKDTRLPVNECSVVLIETESCEDEKPVESMDSSKPNEIHEELELSNDSKTETLSDFTIPDQEVTDNSIASQEETTEDLERTSDPKLMCDSVVSSDATSEKSLPKTDTSLSTIQSQTDIITVNSAPLSPRSPDPDDPTMSHESASASCDASEIRNEKISSNQPSDAKTSSGTDTPQQGKRKKVTMDLSYVVFLYCTLNRFPCWSIEIELASLPIIKSQQIHHIHLDRIHQYHQMLL